MIKPDKQWEKGTSYKNDFMGVYTIWLDEEIVYVGTTKNMYRQYYRYTQEYNLVKNASRRPIMKFLLENKDKLFTFKWIATENMEDAYQMESDTIEVNKPIYNSNSTGRQGRPTLQQQLQSEYERGELGDIKRYDY